MHTNHKTISSCTVCARRKGLFDCVGDGEHGTQDNNIDEAHVVAVGTRYVGI